MSSIKNSDLFSLKGSMEAQLKWGFAILAMSSICVATSDAEVVKAPAFASMCVESDNTGYDWEKGKWVRTTFTKSTFVVRKIFPNELRSSENPNGCFDFMKEQDFEFGDLASVDGCYSTSELGEKPFSSWCREYYDRTKNGSWMLRKIDCANSSYGEKITFEPNGLFIWHMIHGDTSQSPNDDYKDSLSISHGRCSVIE